jgi:protein-S-isoprenylcysteine O-methyltransferase Ste14
MAVLHFLWPVSRYLAFPYTLVGVLPLLAGILLNAVADREFKRCETTVKPFERSSTLITAFPFSVSRNPMYLGLALLVLGVALLFGTVTPLIPVVVFPVLMDVRFIRIEERMLAEVFGENWEEYRKRVRRWL